MLDGVVSLVKPRIDVSKRPKARPSSGADEGAGLSPRLPTQDELPYSDGEPLESDRHVLGMQLLISSLKPWLRRRYQGSERAGYVSGDMFLYFSPEQIKSRHFRGPDVLIALGVEPGERKSWVVWQEGKAPDVVIELLSESTHKTDKAIKPRVYRDEVGVREYYWFDPFEPTDFAGFAFPESQVESGEASSRDALEPNLAPNENGWIMSEALGLRLGTWQGSYEGVEAVWLRWYTADGELLLSEDAERAEEQTRRAEEQTRRAEEQARRAEEQIRRADKLARKLRELGLDPDLL